MDQDQMRQELERIDFVNAVNEPLILTVEEAFGIDTDYYRLKYVSWWGEPGDMRPAGFTKCRIDDHTPDGDYVVTVIEDQGTLGIKEFHYTVPADTLMLAFYGTLPDDSA